MKIRVFFYFSFFIYLLIFTVSAEKTLHIEHRGSRKYFKVVPRSEKKQHWRVCDYTGFFFFWRSALWAAKFQLVLKFQETFLICSLILNSRAYWESPRFKVKQSLNSRKSQKPTSLFEYFTVTQEENIALSVIIRICISGYIGVDK